MPRSKLLTVLAALLIAAPVACGGGGVAPDEYASQFCESAEEWSNAVQSGLEDLTGSLGDVGDIQQVKDALVKFLGDLVDETETFSSSVEEIGTPDVDGGEEFQDELVDAFDEVQAAIEDLQEQVEGLSTDDPAAFQSTLQELGTDITEKGQQIEESLQDPPQELEEAISEEGSCGDFNVGG